MWNFDSACIPANKNPRLNECLFLEMNLKKAQMPFIQMLLKGKNSRVDSKPCYAPFFFFLFHTVQGCWLKTNQILRILCMNFGVIRFMYASFGMKETGRKSTWLASGVAECCVWRAVHLAGLFIQGECVLYICDCPCLLSICKWKDRPCPTKHHKFFFFFFKQLSLT